MPDCVNCSRYVRKFGCSLIGNLSLDQKWTDWPEWLKRRAVSACNLAIIQDYCEIITGDVLEIGHGVCKYLRRGTRARGKARWHGIDPKFPTNEKSRSYNARVSSMPVFPDERFDWVVAVQTIEHWHEYGDTIAAGLSECRRVLKTGGKLLVVAPMHVHGHPIFYHGMEDEVRSEFATGWTEVKFERWRHDHRPMPKIENWRLDMHNHYNLPPQSSTQLDGPSVWQLEILATK